MNNLDFHKIPNIYTRLVESELTNDNVDSRLSKIRNYYSDKIYRVGRKSSTITQLIRENQYKQEFQKELSNFNSMMKVALPWIKFNLIPFLINQKYGGSEEERELRKTLKRNGISEKIDFKRLLNKTKNIEKLPLFKQLVKFSRDTKKFGTKQLNELSIFLSKNAGAPGPFKFPILGSIIGMILENIARTPIEIALLTSAPPLAIAVQVIKVGEVLVFINDIVNGNDDPYDYDSNTIK